MNAARFRYGTSAAFAALAFVVTTPTPAHAQAQGGSVLIEPAIPPEFDRGRNVSVNERRRPDYDQLGIRTGAFVVYPSVNVYAGYTDNVLLTNNAKSDGFAGIIPTLRVESDWNRHQLRLRARGDLQRYFDTSRRNQNAWEAAALGRIDVHSTITVLPEVQISRVYETPFSGGIQSDFSILSSYVRTYTALRGRYEAGQFLVTLAGDRTSFDFSSLDVGNGTRVSQRDRDRAVWRGTVQAEYALSPSASFFGQGSYERVDYKHLLLTGGPNRSADVYRVLGGMNLDLAGFLRGSVGVGYMDRSFDASGTYRKLRGFAAQARLEYFPSDVTTFTLVAGRTIEDSNITNTSGYYDNSIGGRVDHELLHNLILTGMVDYSHQKYVGADFTNDVVAVRGQGRYLASRTLNFNAAAAYTKRSRNSVGLGTNFDEFRLTVGVTVQR